MELRWRALPTGSGTNLLRKIEDRQRERVIAFQTNFMLYVPVFVKTGKEIVFMSPGKSLEMNDINHGHKLANYSYYGKRKQV